MDLIGDWHALLRPDEELTPRFYDRVRRVDARARS